MVYYTLESVTYYPGIPRTPLATYSIREDVAPPAPAAVAASTGVNPVETSYSLYGHNIPLLVLGRGRIGGEIISGPTVDSGAASGINSFGVQADPTRTLTLIEIAFDSEVVWEGTCVGNPSAAVAPDVSGFRVEPFTVRFYTGSLTQPADPLETVPYGANAVAYRGQVLLAFDDLPLANTKFKKYPYVSARFVDEDGEAINFGEAFERLAASPYVNFADFETSGITDGVPDGGFIITQDVTFLQLIQQFGRFYPQWDILQTDKLRIVDRGPNVLPDLTLNATRLMGDIGVTRQGSDTISKDLALSTIDPNADYTIIETTAQRRRDPVAVTTSIGKDSAYLPVVMDASTRTAIVTLAKYHEEAARKTISGTAMAYGLEMEPGALLSIEDLGDDFNNERFRVIETLHGVNNVVEFTAAAILRCRFGDECTEALQFFARAPGLDGTHVDAYTDLICGLVEDGIWDKLDLLRIYATQSSSIALLNVKSSSYTGTIHGSPTFTADAGFTGIESSTTTYIDSGFDPSTAGGVYTRDLAHVSGWCISPTAMQPAFGYENAGSTSVTHIWPKYVVDGLAYNRVNIGGAGHGSSGIDPVGHFVANRPGLHQVYRNGVQYDFALSAAPALNNLNFYELGTNNNGTALGSGNQQLMVSAGADLTDPDIANFYSRLLTYMTAVGAPI